MAALQELLNTPTGMHFVPTPEELIGYYLTRRILGEQTGVIEGSIHDSNIYASDPDRLTGTDHPSNGLGQWFFFSECTRQSHESKKINRRDAAGGTWQLQQGKKPVFSKGRVRIGYRQNFRYVAKDRGKTDWLVEEYCTDYLKEAAGDKVHVICKIYKTPRAPQDQDLQESSIIGSKREAEENAESPISKRARVASPVGKEMDSDVDADDFSDFIESSLAVYDNVTAPADALQDHSLSQSMGPASQQLVDCGLNLVPIDSDAHDDDFAGFIETTLSVDDYLETAPEAPELQDPLTAMSMPLPPVSKMAQVASPVCKEMDSNAADDDFGSFIETTLSVDDYLETAPEAPERLDPLIAISMPLQPVTEAPQGCFLPTPDAAAGFQELLLSRLISLLPQSVSALERQDFYSQACGLVAQIGGVEGNRGMQPSWLPSTQQLS